VLVLQPLPLALASVQEECLTVGVQDRLMLTVLIMLSAALMAVLMCAREQVLELLLGLVVVYSPRQPASHLSGAPVP